jgi:hypothetical protein
MTSRTTTTSLLTAIASILFAAPVFAAVPEFNPETPLDLDRYEGSERPDQDVVMERFNGTFGAIDQCVESERKRAHVEQVDGNAFVDVLLNPEGNRPLGVNAKTDASKTRSKLQGCLREAVASANFPGYDGPPVVVNFEFEIDPGYED